MATTATNANSINLTGTRAIASRLERVTRSAGPTRASAVSLLAGLAVWELGGRLLHYSFLPPFSDVLGASAELIASGQILPDLAVSLAGLAAGYGLAAGLGVALGLLMGRYRKVEYLFDVYLNGFLAAPKIVFIPILFAFFGVGRPTQVAVIFLSAFFVIVANTMSAVRLVDPTYVEMARSFGAQERQLIWRVLIPGALPLTLAGLRLGMGRAVKGMINGEMFIAVFGLGGLLRTYGSRFDAVHVFAVLLVVIAVALACSSVVQAFERHATRWTELEV
jgi:NitT/TauT family transport system permease protein